MTKKHLFLAAAAGVALFLIPARAVDVNNFPETHLGGRHIPFTGSYSVLAVTDEGTPATNGSGYLDRHGTSQLTLSVPVLGITDLVLPFSTVSSADLDAEGNGSTWGMLEGNDDGTQTGLIHFAGRDHILSDTLRNQTRQYGGCMWGGPLDGANLLATEQIEVTTDGDGSVISTTSVVEGILIVPFYADFAPFEGVDPLPPLKPVTELPAGTGWRTYVLDSEERAEWVASTQSIYIHQTLSSTELGFRDLLFPIEQTAVRYDDPVGRRYGGFEFQPIGQNEPSCGHTAFQGMMGYVVGTEKTVRHDYMDHAGVFQSGPFAGCLYMRSHGGDVGLAPPFFLSTVLLVPDGVDLDPMEPQKILNISERKEVGTGSDVLIAGFVVAGELPRSVLIRAIGPSLAQFDVTGILEDPELKVFRSAEPEPILIGSNDNWADGFPIPIERASVQAGAFPLTRDTKDAAILFSWLEPGAYTVQVSGVGGTTGVALAEVYEIGN